jgi:SAM-dependent methyltransferase
MHDHGQTNHTGQCRLKLQNLNLKMSLPETDFDRERQWWDAKAPKEERDGADEAINRALRWREIERHLEGVGYILDVGAGTGAFSIPLARRGFHVVHLDFSPQMLAIAKEKARGLTNIEFCEGNGAELSQFSEGSFDLVLNMDGAISFSGSKAIRAIHESCRVTKKKLILTVSHQAQMIASWISLSLARTGQLGPAVDAMLERGEWHQEQFPANQALTQGLTQNYLGSLRAFSSREITKIIEGAGLKISRCGGLGSLAGLCEPEALLKIAHDGVLLESFLSICEQFDRDILPQGPGTRQRAGLIAVAER